MIWKVFDNLHILWMGIWSHHHTFFSSLAVPDFGSQLKSLVTAWRWMKPVCSGWGSKSTWNDSHSLSIHMKGDWQPSYSYAVDDWDSDPSSCHYQYAGKSRFGTKNLPQILGHCLALNEATVQWLRLEIHMEWFLQPLQTYERWKVIINLHMLWMGIWIHHHAITSTPVNWDLGRKRSNPWSCLALNEAIVHWLRLQIYMEWFPHLLHTYERWLTTIICCGWGYRPIIMPLPIGWLLIQIWEEASNPWSLLGAEWSHCAVVEAPNPHGMVPTTSPYIWKVIDNLHMLWMGI